jgi:hypothetical protein
MTTTERSLPPSIAHVSRDGRDLAIMASEHRVLLIRDFQRLCRGETSIGEAGQVLHLLPGEECLYLAFEHGRVCAATVCRFYTLISFLYIYISFGSFMGFISSTLTKAIPSTRQRSCSCNRTPSRLDHIATSAACNSPIVAFILRGKTQDVGMSRCL